jgi:hypothetical protein
MNILRWAEKNAQKMKWHHFSALKIGVASSTLLFAKLFPVLLELEWYWYAGIFVVSYIITLFGFFGNGRS